MNLLMLICATLASLAFGVLVAYGICQGAFVLLRQHAGHVAAQRARAQVAKGQMAKGTIVAPVTHADSV